MDLCKTLKCANDARYTSGYCGICDISENLGKGELLRTARAREAKPARSTGPMANLALEISAERVSILKDVCDERRRQVAQWGKGGYASHDKAFRVLGEEVGEVAKALNDKEPIANLRAELIQVAAVCVRWVEGIDAEGGS